MKITYNWLKDFVEIKIPLQKLVEKLTMAGLEVTSLEKRDGDFVFEIEVTSNRPDWLSVVGIAREVAAITGRKLASWPVSPLTGSSRRSPKPVNPLTITIENKNDCPLYTARIIENVKVGPSPDWLKKRLEFIGCRSVNNIADITNYVLFEFGEPMHAFDLDKLLSQAGKQVGITVRRGKEGEEIITIDGEKSILNKNILVIAAGRPEGRPIAIAGIMGGKDTEVTATTKNVLLEAAIFNPLVIRRARQTIGLQTESSYRFERGIAIETVERASLRAVALIEEASGGKLASSSKVVLLKKQKKKIRLDVSKVKEILGIDAGMREIKKILGGLEFKVNAVGKENLSVEVPSHRQDINQPVDLIEEVARIYGYENIPLTLPKILPMPNCWDTSDKVLFIKNILIGLGLQEVITYSLIDKELVSEAIEIQNPLSQEHGILRPSLALSLASCVAYNLRQKQESVNIFELAKVYNKHNGEIEERYSLGIALCGRKLCWAGKAYTRVEDDAGILHLKGILESVLKRLGIQENEYNFIQTGPDSFGLQVKSDQIGSLIKLDETNSGRLDIKNKDVFIAEVVLDKLFEHIKQEKKFIPFSRYPGISRDISLVIKEETVFEDVLKVIKESGGELLKEARLIDYYKGKHIEAGSKGLTISCFYCSSTRTLSEADIEQLHLRIIDSLKKCLGAVIR
ncbi:MAG: phenylalanine--tRNA ligase subunit beta [Candidatus Omnitrophica bacterium]|nr:phenylalanine--tRNA ligase subunit beta [Candidatus Omnitrophota bacterium]